jgi:hypothetical protein
MDFPIKTPPGTAAWAGLAVAQAGLAVAQIANLRYRGWINFQICWM